MSMQHFTLPSGPFATNCYLVACSRTGEAVVIDPAADARGWIQKQLEKEKWLLKAIWLTHSHWDHFADAHALQQHYDKITPLPLAVHRLDVENVRHPGADGLPSFIPIAPARVDQVLEDQEELTLGTLTFKVLHTPGHSPGGVCFYEPKEGVLFSGDTLFKGTIGNLSFPTSSEEAMWSSLTKLSHLPLNTKVYPGHGPATTIGAESWLANAKERFG